MARKTASAAVTSSSGASVLVGLGPAAQGWFQHFTVAIGRGATNPDGSPSWLYGANADWGRVPDVTYQGQADASTCSASGDIDGDGLDEIVVGTGPTGQGVAHVFKQTGEGWVPFATVRLTDFTAYTSTSEASTWPACVDVDGDGRAEVVLGTGARGQGFAQIWRYDASTRTFSKMDGTPYANGYVRAGWADYNAGADASVRPAGGYLAGKGAGRPAQLVLGLGPRGQGWVQIWGWSGGRLQPYALTSSAGGWVQVRWSAYTGAGDAPALPALGDLDGDGRDDLALGLGDRGQGWVETFHVTASDVVPQAWVQVPWTAYTASGQASTRPTLGDLDGDGRADLVVGLSGSGKGWMFMTRSGSAAGAWTQIQWAAFTANAGCGTWPVAMRGRPLAVRSLQITPATPAVPLGTTQSLVATAVFENDATLDVSGAVTWSSSAPAVATVTSGTLTPLTVGETRVTARLGAATGSVAATVTPAALVRIDVAPATPSVPVGLSQQMSATGVYTDGSHHDLTTQVTWACNMPDIATVSPTGLARGAGTGTATVSATLGIVSGSVSFTVTPAVLQSIGVSPPAATVPKGLPQALQATGLYSDGTHHDLSTLVRWTSSAPACVSVSASGMASTLTVGDAEITASIDGLEATAIITVTDAALASIAVTPALPSIPLGLIEQLTATGTYTDGSTLDLTGLVAWSSSGAAVVVSNAEGEQGRCQALSTGIVTVTARRGAVSGSATVTATPARLQAIEVTSAAPSLPKGLTCQLTATGRFSDGTHRDVTSEVTWSGDAFLAVSNAAGSNGLATAEDMGRATVRATLGDVGGSTSIDVTAAVLQAITVSPAAATIPKGVPQTLQASGTYSDGTRHDLSSQVTWRSSAPGCVSVSVDGVASTLAVGEAAVTASLGDIEGAAAITVTDAALVSIAVTPALPSVPLGLTEQLTAIGTYTDGSTLDLTRLVAWSSSDAAIAVSNAEGEQGRCQALSNGTATVTAAQGAVHGSATVTATPAVLKAIDVTSSTSSVPRGLTCQLTATGRFSDNTHRDLTAEVTWSGDALLTVSNAAGSNGLATGVEMGRAGVTAALGDVSGSATIDVTAAALKSITVSPAAATIPKGVPQTLQAVGLYSDATHQDLSSQVSWSSSTPACVSVSASGVASTLSVGEATVTASLGGVQGAATITVTDAALVSIGVTPALPSVPLGLTEQLTATGTYTDGSTLDLTRLVSWSSSDAAIAVSNAHDEQGRCQALSIGSATVTAAQGAVSGSATVIATPARLQAIEVTSSTSSLPKGLTCQLTATGRFSDNTHRDLTTEVTWSGDAFLAVSNASGSNGLATGVETGRASVTAALGDVSGSASLDVVAAALQSITVSPAAATVPKGVPQALQASGSYSDGTRHDLSSQVTWSSSAPGCVSMSVHGVASTLSVGEATVTASLGGIEGAAMITVTDAALVSIAVTPALPSVPLGLTEQLTATGTYTDGSTLDVTRVVSWSSSDAAVAVSNAQGEQGRCQALSIGSATVTAAQGAVSGSATVTATPARLQAIEVTSAAPSLPKGLTCQLTATGSFSDGTHRDLTTEVTWSGDACLAVSNAAGSNGLATGLSTGRAGVTAALGAVTGGASIDVTAPALVGLRMSPVLPVLIEGRTLAMRVAGVYTDASTVDLTASLTWTSSQAGAATVSDQAGSKGRATAVAVGTTTIGAADPNSGLHTETTLTVVARDFGAGYPAAARIGSAPSPADAVAVDFNRDGIVDVAVTYNASSGLGLPTPGGVLVYLGQGGGAFAAPVAVSDRTNSAFELWAPDVNGDGRRDLVWGTSGGLRVALGAGDGTFTVASSGFGRQGTGSTSAFGDFNGDGTDDALLAFSQTVILAETDASGAAVRNRTFQVGATVKSVNLVDVTGDGRADLLAVTAGGLAVMCAGADGSVGPLVMFSGGSNPSSEAAVGDFDGDGKADVLLISNSANATLLLRGNGDGTFQAATAGPGVSHAYRPLVADVDGDGHLDVVGTVYNSVDANHTTNSAFILYGGGDGTFRTRYLGTDLQGFLTPAVAVGDVDGDGRKDLIDPAGPSIWRQRSDGSWNAPLTFDAGAVPSGLSTNLLSGAAQGDLDRNGWTDYVIASSALSGLRILLNDGSGVLAAPSTLPLSASPRGAVAVGDLNGDGWPDIVAAVGASPAYTLQVLLSNGDGTFRNAGAASGQQFSATGVYALVTGDFDGDGRLDLASADGTVRAFRGNGDGTFGAPVTVGTGSGLKTGDLNLDGRTDLLVISYSAAITWFGASNFTFSGGYPVGALSTVYDAAIGDTNGDGIPDVVVGGRNSFGPRVVVARGTGTGDTTAWVVNTVANNPTRLALADVTGAGHDDLVMTFGTFTLSLAVFPVNADRTLGTPLAYAAPPRADVLQIADLNHDGRPDIVTLDGYNGLLRALLHL